jgi:hypothetical protein
LENRCRPRTRQSSRGHRRPACGAGLERRYSLYPIHTSTTTAQNRTVRFVSRPRVFT